MRLGPNIKNWIGIFYEIFFEDCLCLIRIRLINNSDSFNKALEFEFFFEKTGGERGSL